MNVTLIGMPGAGKSFVGKELAKRLGFEFIETDKLIEKEYGSPLQQVVEKLGPEDFLDKEAEVIIKSIEGRSNIVISPGGSVIYREPTMEHLQKLSKIFYLQVSLEILSARVGTTPRGIVAKNNATLDELYAERVPLYEQFASYIIDGARTPELIVEDILSKI